MSRTNSNKKTCRGESNYQSCYITIFIMSSFQQNIISRAKKQNVTAHTKKNSQLTETIPEEIKIFCLPDNKLFKINYFKFAQRAKGNHVQRMEGNHRNNI